MKIAHVLILPALLASFGLAAVSKSPISRISSALRNTARRVSGNGNVYDVIISKMKLRSSISCARIFTDDGFCLAVKEVAPERLNEAAERAAQMSEEALSLTCLRHSFGFDDSTKMSPIYQRLSETGLNSSLLILIRKASPRAVKDEADFLDSLGVLINNNAVNDYGYIYAYLARNIDIKAMLQNEPYRNKFIKLLKKSIGVDNLGFFIRMISDYASVMDLSTLKFEVGGMDAGLLRTIFLIRNSLSCYSKGDSDINTTDTIVHYILGIKDVKLCYNDILFLFFDLSVDIYRNADMITAIMGPLKDYVKQHFSEGKFDNFEKSLKGLFKGPGPDSKVA